MPSTQLHDADARLVQGYLLGKMEYELDNPGKSLIVTCTYRSPQEQWELYQQGRTKPGPVVTQIDGRSKLSNHNYHPARALDFAVVVNGKTTWADQEYKIVGPHMQRYGLMWGGAWLNFKDYPHLELPKEG